MPAADPRAHAKVMRAIKEGRLVRPSGCEKCGRGCKPHAHHDDYAKPLDVRWLCPTCHRREPLGANAREDLDRQVNLRLHDDMFERVEQARGDVPREAWIRAAVEASLGGFDANREWKRMPPAVGWTRSPLSKRDVRPIPKGKR